MPGLHFPSVVTDENIVGYVSLNRGTIIVQRSRLTVLIVQRRNKWRKGVVFPAGRKRFNLQVS